MSSSILHCRLFILPSISLSLSFFYSHFHTPSLPIFLPISIYSSHFLSVCFPFSLSLFFFLFLFLSFSLTYTLSLSLSLSLFPFLSLSLSLLPSLSLLLTLLLCQVDELVTLVRKYTGCTYFEAKDVTMPPLKDKTGVIADEVGKYGNL